MKKALIVIIVILGLVTALGAGSMVLVDNEISKAVNRLNSHVDAPVTISVVSDTNSFFERQLVLNIDLQTVGEPIYASLKNDIQKRPWGTSIEHALTLSSSLIDMVDSAQLSSFLEKNFINSPIVAGNTEISMVGTYHSNLASFSVNESFKGADVFFAPWSVSIQGNIRGDLAVNSDWGGMHLVNNESSAESFDINWQPIALIAEGKYYGGSTFVGSQTLTSNGVSIVSEDVINPIDFQIGNSTITSLGDVENGRFTSDLRFSSESVNYNVEGETWRLADLIFHAEISGLDIENFTELTRELNALNETGILEPSPILTRTANKALQDGFSFALPEMSAKIDGNLASGSFSASLPENSFADISNLFSLIGLIPTLVAQTDIRIPSDIVENPEFAEQFSGLVAMGALIEDNEHYVLSATFKNGTGTLNGNPIPLPF